MNIMLVGAAGYIGRVVLKELLKRNIKVTAIIKEEENLKLKDYNLRIEQKDILDPSIEEIMEQNTVIILSSIVSEKSIKEQKNAYKLIISRMKDAGKKKILILFEMKIEQSEIVKKEILELFKPEKEIEWSMLVIPRNAETGDKTERYNSKEYKGIKDETVVFIEDIAVAAADEIEKNRYIRKEFTIEY
jgi:uncharacterized protein